MNTRKQKLIGSLKVAITALENGTIAYDWSKQCSCNCGVIAQAVLGESRENIDDAFHPQFNTSVRPQETRENKIDRTWKKLVQYTCDITGETSVSILNRLKAAGMTPQDIVHLEYLENPAILERANIMLTRIVETKTKTGETKRIVPTAVETKKRYLFFTKTKTTIENREVVEEQFESNSKEEKYYETNYFTKKENLIKYLKAWVSILEEKEEEVTPKMTKQQMHQELLKAVASEEFEKAAELRNKIAVLA